MKTNPCKISYKISSIISYIIPCKIKKALFGIILIFAVCLAEILTCTGCGRSGQEDFQWTKHEENQLVYYLAEHTSSPDEPLVVLLHGLGGGYADMLETAKCFYYAGYAVASFDLYGNGEELYDYDIYLNEMLEGSKNKLEMILGLIQRENVCDTSELALYGTSLGGLAAFYEGAFGISKPKVIITLASCPDIEDTFERVWYYIPTKRKANESFLEYMTEPEYKNLMVWASDHNPADKIEALSQSAILMVNGTADQYMSMDRVRSFKEKIEASGGNIEVYENENGKHDAIGDYRIDEMLQFLARYLPLQSQTQE